MNHVGPSFIDEAFRVWARTRPDVHILPRSMNRDVEFIVRRGLAMAEELESRSPPR